MSDVDQEFLQSAFRSCPFHKHLDLELVVIGKGKVEVIVYYRPELDHAAGVLHGGVFGAALDTSTYYAALSHYGPTGRFPMTQEYKINLLSPARQENICAVAEVLKAGKTTAVAQAKIFAASGKLVAAGMASFIIPPG
ncbi:MAG: PaaI family thioesterase [Polyangiaceae bacterium]|nr:PaaI family thioesterase [Polyangiaceae bacterium]